ncbi:hypothetical protein BUALT_Bualt06G0066200 [Buddleja alternifolia]|uniref:Vacuolar protein sorting-associated protein 13A n=1 Tax=Buddleja alternifolia TaxID=168488 RepID=A0AAV6XL43_9LAMI|nr:hypothetical protein BUALT_Bualt06G0066200 [Buddleja alternifolia]
MFEGLVRQLILGYLGKYIKDIQKEQLKITLWNEEVLLENVELILEAFDYLRLPFAFRQGRVGKLSIKIPWKKLGWDPIIIILEDVYICVCKRDEKEWSMDAVERREFASKKAQLAAAELAKLSRRVCDNQTGKSFISYITAKILDSIQISIRNVHVLYCDSLTATAEILFGLKFSSLTIMKQSPVGSYGAKVREGQVNKLIEVQSLELYCDMFGKTNGSNTENGIDSKNMGSGSLEDGKYSSLLAPLNVLVSLSVNRSGRLLNDVPQYTIVVELSSVATSMDEVQLQQILSLCDYMSLCRLREKYGRYRPWWSPLSKRLKGWKKAWWHYAQESVLSDVRRRLRKTSWKYFGERLSSRRKYVNLYKEKLKCLRHDQVMEDDVQHELEEMEKETDIDDILNYRSVAERELEDFLVNPFSRSRSNGGIIDKSVEDDRPSKPRGWLNWLSYGMLGAGGTDDSNQFSGVISDDVIKDIYEATKFHPASVLTGDSAMTDEVYFSSMKIKITEFRTTLRSMGLRQAIADLMLKGISIEGKVWEKSAIVTASVDAAQMLNPFNSQVVFFTKKVKYEDNVREKQQPSLNIKVDLSPPSCDVNSSVKVILNPTEVFCDLEFVKNIADFLDVLRHLSFLQQRILLSLNGIDDLNSRLFPKIDYVLSSRKKMMWDINLLNTVINIPWKIANSEVHNMILETAAISLTSKSETDSTSSHMGVVSQLNKYVDSGYGSIGDIEMRFHLQDLYNQFEIQINDAQMTLMMPSATLSIVEKFNASASLASCILFDEPILKGLEVCVQVPSLTVHFSASIYREVVGLIAQFNMLLPSSDSTASLEQTSLYPWFSINGSLDAIYLLVNLDDNLVDGCTLKLEYEKLGIWYDQKDLSACWASLQACRITASHTNDDWGNHILCSTGSIRGSEFVSQHNVDVNLDGQNGHLGDGSSTVDGSIVLHIVAHGNTQRFPNKCTIYARDLDIHCHPFIVAELISFSDKILVYGTSDTEDRKLDVKDEQSSRHGSEIQQYGLLNENGSYESAGSPLDHIPKRFSVPIDADSSKQTCNDTDLLLVSLNLGRTTVHFHDSAGIVAAVTVPLAKSLITISANSLDIVCSTEGVVLSSSWWSQIINEFLWGPSSLNLSPILNLHMKKRNIDSRNSQLEVSFDIQQVSCMLPPEFLAILIGYFSIPDWSPYTEEQPTDTMSFEDPSTVAYSFNIVDCNVITPAKSDCSEFLKIDIKQLCIAFSQNIGRNFVTKDIPSACCIGAGKFCDRTHCLDFFGCDLSLSLLLLEKDMVNPLSRCQKKVTLIPSLSADVWVRIPCNSVLSDVASSYPLRIMAMVNDCQLDVEEGCVVAGLKALGYVIDQFSLVDEECKIFISDVPHFLRAKKQLMEHTAVLPKTSDVSFTEMKFCVRSLSLRLNRLKRDSTYSQLMAEAEMHFVCSLSLMNNKAQCFDISFSSLSLFSFLNSVVLAEFSCPGSGSSVLDMICSVSDYGENRIVVSFPFLDVWLHLFDWNEIIDLLGKCSEQLSTLSSATSAEAMASNHVESAGIIGGAGFSTLTFEHVGLAVHFPAKVSRNTYSTFGRAQLHDKQPLDECLLTSNPYCFLSVSLESRNSELVVDGKTMKLTISSENLNGILKLFMEDSAQTWPLFQLSKIYLEAEMFEYKNINLFVRSASLDLSLSNHILFLFDFTWFEKSEEMSSQFSFNRMDFQVQLRKFSVLLTDWKVDVGLESMKGLEYVIGPNKGCESFCHNKLTSNGPLLEFLLRNSIIRSIVTDNEIEGSVGCDLQVNYYNIDKVLWEPFMETWKFQLSMSRRHDERALFNKDIMTDINLESATHLNLNLNESIIEVVWRAIEMIKDAWGLMEIKESPDLSNFQITRIPDTRRYAPYILQNLTTLPIVFNVCQQQIRADDLDVSPSVGVLQPGSFTPVYINESPEELLFRYRPVQSFDTLNDKQLLDAAHRYVTFQLEGTSAPSAPISMDLVGQRYFEVEFSKPSNVAQVYNNPNTMKRNIKVEGGSGTDATGGFVIPVVIDVSVQRFTKLMRLYSTVVILNATSVSLEVRFDIPFGVAPKILGPIYPGQEFPVPLHLAETGCIRWRPLGESYLWSEAHNMSSIISQDVRIGFLRSFVCYPSHPSSEAFRCCISVNDQCLLPVGRSNRVYSPIDADSGKQSRFLYQVMLTSPLVLKNFLTKSISVILECAGVARTAFLSEVETSFYHIDSSHDLLITFQMHGFRPSTLNYPRAESFSAKAKFSGTKFSISEIIRFDPDFNDGPLYVTVEKVMDAVSGAREIFISVPLLLFNCTGFSLVLSKSVNQMKGNSCVIPSCYNLDEQNILIEKKDGLGLVCPDQDIAAKGEENLNLPGCRKVTACLFSPDPHSSSGEVMVKLSRKLPCVIENYPKGSWSAQFSIVPQTGSTSVIVPQPSLRSSGYVLSVSAVAAPFSGTTKIITFQPRYVIANACTKNLCYKQKGTDFPFLLGAGQHSHIQWMDTTRELLLCVRFDEPGWEWSGCFLPEQLGESMVKVRNYMSSGVSMMRVEVRSADVSVGEEKIVGSTTANSGTNLILLSRDDTAFMPYRIDNHSRERLRIYQPKCESFETVIHPYTSSPYAWDEPYYPHRLIIEVPGERVLGAYAIDEASAHSLAYLPATSEKPERNLLISVHSEGAIKVLSIIDSSHHVLSDLKSLHVPQLKDKRKQTHKYESFVNYKERLSIDIPFLGISLMNSHPEELLFACAKNTKVNFIQSFDQQHFSLQIASLQIDNQLRTTLYPVILSFKSNVVNQIKFKDNSGSTSSHIAASNLHEPVFSLAVAKWRNTDPSLVSFESISLRIADFYLEIEQDIVLRLFEFCKTASARLQSRVFQLPTQNLLFSSALDFTDETSRGEKHLNCTDATVLGENYQRGYLLPDLVPIGAPWQKIHLDAPKQKKIYVELFDMGPIKLTLSFSSTPWILRNGVLTSGESLIHRGLMALADVEGAKIHFKQLILSHQMASWESIQEILVSHYTRQFLHEMYKVFGSAGVIGNPLGFARSLGLGIKEFFSLPIWSVFQGIVAFTLDDQTGTMTEWQQKGMSSHSKGVINEFLEGLTGVLQSPIKGAEKHGLPGVLSGIAVGVTGLVAKPAASILEVTGKTAQSIRNRSRTYQMGFRHFRIRLPRPLSSESPLKPYSWEEAVGTYVLTENDMKLRDEMLVMCKSLKQCGQYALITRRLILVVSCSSLIELGKPTFEGVPANPKWNIKSEIGMDSVILADNDGDVVHIVGSGSDTLFRQNLQQQQQQQKRKGKLWYNFDTPLPLVQTNLEFTSPEEADEFLRVVMCMIERGKEQGWGSLHILHQTNIK